MTETRSALVLGATGGIGGEVAAALLRRGWQVVGMARNPDTARLPGIRWIAGDATDADAVRRAAEGAQVIVHAVNPPGYRGWAKVVLPMIDNTIAAAKAVGARIVLPGTIYNYGDDAFPNLREVSPQNPKTDKGRIRVELEQRLEEASRNGVAVLIVRFGDFFGPAARSNWFSQGFVQPGKRLGAITYPGPTGIGHAWAYLPDAAETIARLLDRSESLEPFARFHFAGVWDGDGTQMTKAIADAVGRPQTKTKALPWFLVRLAGLFLETPRELYKMRYLWQSPIKLDNSKLVAFIGEEPHTPLLAAVKTTLRALDVR